MNGLETPKDPEELAGQLKEGGLTPHPGLVKEKVITEIRDGLRIVKPGTRKRFRQGV